LAFPERVYTQEEVDKARELVQKGYKHALRITGSPKFKDKMRQVLGLVKAADYYDFVRTYLRQIVEMEGFSQLHEADAALWANMSMLDDVVNAASYVVQKAQQMKDYLEGNLYYGTGEMAAIEKRLEFLNTLKRKSESEEVRARCEQLLKDWADTRLQFP
jgi:DNA repair ATPase RecN